MFLELTLELFGNNVRRLVASAQKESQKAHLSKMIPPWSAKFHNTVCVK